MKSPLLIALVWAATVAVAFLLGGRTKPDAPARDASRPASESRVETLPAPETPSPREAEAPVTAADAAPGPAPLARPPEPVQPVKVEPGMTPADLSSLFMRYAKRKLAEGPEGHKELFREMDRLLQDQQLRQMFRDEQQMMPFAYPWVKFLVDHDQQVVAMMETIYRTAAEDPQWFQGLDDDPMEMFAEGLAMLLPGVADEEQLARFRGYAERILAHPKEGLPRALERNLSDIQRDIEWWSPAVRPEDLVKALNDAAVPAAKKIGLLRRADPAALRGVDVTSILASGIREGNQQAMHLASRFRDSVNVATLDTAFLDAAASGSAAAHFIMSYASSTGRGTWETLRPFLDTGLGRGGKATEAFAQSLIYSHVEVPREYVTTLIATYGLSEQVRTQLKKRYRIE